MSSFPSPHIANTYFHRFVISMHLNNDSMRSITRVEFFFKDSAIIFERLIHFLGGEEGKISSFPSPHIANTYFHASIDS